MRWRQRIVSRLDMLQTAETLSSPCRSAAFAVTEQGTANRLKSEIP